MLQKKNSVPVCGCGKGRPRSAANDGVSEADSAEHIGIGHGGPPSSASEKDETLRSWDASGSASDGEERRSAADHEDEEDAASTAASSSSSTSSRDDWLQNMLSGMERYNPAHVAPLEALVQRQADGEETYNADANLALLALYQYNPRRFDAARARQVLLLAMGRLPLPDLTLCKCLLPGALAERPPLSGVLALAELLERCSFAAFWDRVAAQPDLLAGVAGLRADVRAFVAHVVGSAFQRLSLRRLNALLGGLPDVELRQWLERRGWKVEEPTGDGMGPAEPMVFVGSQEQVVRNRRIVERVELDTVERLLARLAD